MLKVVSKGVFKEENLQKVIALYQDLIAETHKEHGCLSYELYQDTENPCVLTMIETWENRASLEAHFVTAHSKRLVPEIGKFKENGKDLHIYTKLA